MMSVRRWRILAKVSSAMLPLMPILLYLLWVAPIFEDSEVTNSAVLEVINSEPYKQAAAEAYALLALYNQGTVGLDELHGVQGVQQVRGVTVAFNLELVARDEPREGGGTKYKLAGHYRVSLSTNYFIVFLGIEVALLGLVVLLFLLGPPKAQRRFEEQILQAHFCLDQPATSERADQSVERLLERFHRFAKDLEHGPRGRNGIQVKDEYDLQFLVNALLRMQFDNVKPEEPAPSLAAGGTRLDFLLPDHGLVVELKMTRAGMTVRSLADELILDIARYRAHPDCQAILFFVYDPCGLIKNPVALKKELSRVAGEIPVSLVISPDQ
ncbi:hypothetical protein QFZ84_001492 [Pseudomonas fluorescens]